MDKRFVSRRLSVPVMVVRSVHSALVDTMRWWTPVVREAVKLKKGAFRVMRMEDSLDSVEKQLQKPEHRRSSERPWGKKKKKNFQAPSKMFWQTIQHFRR